MVRAPLAYGPYTKQRRGDKQRRIYRFFDWVYIYGTCAFGLRPLPEQRRGDRFKVPRHLTTPDLPEPASKRPRKE